MRFQVFVNFQEDGAVRSLAKALLKRDFNLEVELPHGCLVPRVPQRLNYILFVEDLLELNGIKKDIRFSVDRRSGALLNECSADSEEAERAPPRSATLARRGELEFEGGEVAFVGRLIDDSVLLQSQVSIYTTMLGKKSSITALSKRLSRIDGVRFTVSTLSQGRTQRWVLAWTFLPHIQLEDKNYSSLFLRCPSNIKSSSLQWIRSHLERLGVDTEREDSDMLICSARTVTWTNQRAKRRAEARLMQNDVKRLRMSSSDAGVQVSLGVGDGRDSLCDAGNFDSCDSSLVSASQSDINIQAYFPCCVKPSVLRFRVIQSRENSGASFEYIDGYKPGLYQLLQYLKNQMR
ncbi:hypothetical protein OESDEN_07268 [Oesophagostomum dentatum]|uniref:Uncharacterized protein n=1 Tax=Oesophagostomum dentatum TaxID=61180 RepID=A0A0B1T6F8_OESDE|nr:hypothetical protein OESDEN_07268 [Oesophagostomum dentatum]